MSNSLAAKNNDLNSFTVPIILQTWTPSHGIIMHASVIYYLISLQPICTSRCLWPDWPPSMTTAVNLPPFRQPVSIPILYFSFWRPRFESCPYITVLRSFLGRDFWYLFHACHLMLVSSMVDRITIHLTAKGVTQVIPCEPNTQRLL